MNFYQIIQHIKDNKLFPCKIRYVGLESGEYINVDRKYRKFHSNVLGGIIEWFPNLDDMAANTWEIMT